MIVNFDEPNVACLASSGAISVWGRDFRRECDICPTFPPKEVEGSLIRNHQVHILGPKRPNLRLIFSPVSLAPNVSRITILQFRDLSFIAGKIPERNLLEANLASRVCVVLSKNESIGSCQNTGPWRLDTEVDRLKCHCCTRRILNYIMYA